MDFDLRLLRHARALAEEGSFARAARSQHLTQPALTRSIQELERRTGIKLFDRNKGRVEPTDLGGVFLAHARDLLGRAEALDREVATLRGSGTGRLVVGSGTFPTASFMAEGVAAFLRENPEIGVRVVNDNWAALVAALRRRELDFVVAAPLPPEEGTDLAVQPLSFRQGRFLVRPGHPLVGRGDPSLADIVAWPLICTGRLSAPITDRVLRARSGARARQPLPDVACESHEMMRHVARTTDHVLLSMLSANTAAVAAGELVALPLVDPAIGVTFSILRLESRTLPPIADALARSIVTADRATLEVERTLAATPPARAARSAPGRQRRAAEASAAS
jgi:DNA-binding transcriptional LysR family regulator